MSRCGISDERQLSLKLSSNAQKSTNEKVVDFKDYSRLREASSKAEITNQLLKEAEKLNW